MVVNIDQTLNSQTTSETPLIGELSGSYRGYFSETWPCGSGITLYNMHTLKRSNDNPKLDLCS